MVCWSPRYPSQVSIGQSHGLFDQQHLKSLNAWLLSSGDRSVLSRCLQSTWWPTILRSDSARTQNVSKRVTYLSWLVNLSLILLGVAGVITPFGLNDIVRLDGAVAPVFRYSPDRSAWGYGTPPRYSKLSRVCAGVGTRNCPGRFEGLGPSYNSSTGKTYISQLWVML